MVVALALMVEEALVMMPPEKVARPPKVLTSVSSEEEAEVPPVMLPQVMLPLASVVSALLVLQAPNRPRVVVPTLLTLKSVVLSPATVDEPCSRQCRRWCCGRRHSRPTRCRP